MAKSKEGATPPNIQLKKGAQPITVEGEVNISHAKPIPLPSEDAQRAGWYAERAGELLAQFPDRYLPVVPKG